MKRGSHIVSWQPTKIEAFENLYPVVTFCYLALQKKHDSTWRQAMGIHGHSSKGMLFPSQVVRFPHKGHKLLYAPSSCRGDETAHLLTLCWIWSSPAVSAHFRRKLARDQCTENTWGKWWKMTWVKWRVFNGVIDTRLIYYAAVFVMETNKEHIYEFTAKSSKFELVEKIDRASRVTVLCANDNQRS